MAVSGTTRVSAPVAFLLTLSMLLAACGQSAERYLARANTFYNDGKFDDAVLNFRKAIQKNPKLGEAYYRLALAEFRLGHSREGYTALLSANTLLPDRADVRVTLADVLLLAYFNDKSRPKGFYQRLNTLSDELLAYDRNSYDGLRIKGNLAWLDGRLADAEELFRRANAAKPSQPDLILSWAQALFQDGKGAEAERLSLDLIQRRKDAARIYDLLYQQYRAQDRMADAENILRAKMDNNPSQSSYALQLAAFYAATGKTPAMEAVIKRLLDDPKTYPDARLRVGDFYGSLHEWDAALRQYEEGARQEPKLKTEYLKRIADAWLAQGNGEKAATVIGEILKDRPNDEAAKAVNASLLLKTGRPENIQKAVTDLDELVKKQAENPLLRFALARAMIAKGDVDGARAQFQESIKSRPNYLPSLMALAELSQSKRDFAEAVRYANEALKVNPKLSRARLLRAAAFTQTQKYGEARQELKALESEFPENVDVQFQIASLDLAEKNYPQAEARLQQLIGKDKMRALAGLVNVYNTQGEFEKSISRLTMELGKTPNEVGVNYMLADTAARAHNYDLALKYYGYLEVLGVRSEQLQLRLGAVYQMKGEIEKAIASYRAAVELAPRNLAAIGALADAQRIAGRNAEATVTYRRLLALDPENENALNNLAFTLLDANGSVDEAQKLVEQALRKAPRSPNFADTLGMVYLKKNLDDSAIQVFSGLTARFPDNPVFRYHYALSLSQKGQKAKAKTELEVALRKAPPDDLRRDIQTTLARIQQ